MKISELYNKGKTVFAIEVFPPKKMSTDSDFEDEASLSSLREIASLKPDYISVTCGAGGSSVNGVINAPTLKVSSFIKNECKVESVAHITCVSCDKPQVVDTLNALKNSGVENILALRGDINPSVPRKSDFTYADSLIRFIRENDTFNNFGISGACYPEGHAEAESMNGDLKNLKNKVCSGCETLISQLFFDNSLFYPFLEKARLIGIEIPISAGIMPITSKSQIERMVSMCGASLPPKFVKMIAKYETRPEALRDAGIAYATEQIIDLISNGVDGIHLYAMNSPYVARKVAENIGNLL